MPVTTGEEITPTTTHLNPMPVIIGEVTITHHHLTSVTTGGAMIPITTIHPTAPVGHA